MVFELHYAVLLALEQRSAVRIPAFVDAVTRLDWAVCLVLFGGFCVSGPWQLSQLSGARMQGHFGPMSLRAREC